MSEVEWHKVDLKEVLLRRAKAFCGKRGITLSTLSKMAVDRGHALKRLEEGADMQIGTFQRFMRFIHDQERRFGGGRDS